MEQASGTITVSLLSVFHLLLGGFLAFWVIRGYYLKEKSRYSAAKTVVSLTGGIAWMVIGLLQLLNILNERWALVAFTGVICVLLLQEMVLEIARTPPGPPGTRKVLTAVYGVVLILIAALCYVAFRDAYRL
ncbi:MAG: hypothetical protein HY914_17820 [Desulfomonile tiedjei]|nr:hypothetical protein [Desulfomonile tiedjei]